jgi:FKBP-type peptidyl-prolyl cis-trans isomerase SlyD
MKDAAAENMTVQDNMVVTLEYVLKVDGEVIDQSSDTGAIEFLQGQEQVIRGLEQAIYGMAAGERRTFKVAPVDGYGEVDEENFAEIPRSEFPAEIPLEKGVELQLRDQDGELFEAFIQEIGEDTIYLNFNHPLAGKELDFEVTVTHLRPATVEEIEHGHVHS